MSNKAWMASTRLLIITSIAKLDTLPGNSDLCSVNHLKDYLMNGGDCISLFQTLVPDWLTVTTEDCTVQFEEGVEDLFVKHVISPSRGILVAPSYNVNNVDSSILSLLPHILEKCFHINCNISESTAAAPNSHEEQINALSTTGHLVAEPFHEEAFFRKATSVLGDGKIDSQQTTFQLFNDDFRHETEHLTITRIQSQLQQHRFNQLEYFKVIIKH